MTPRHLLALGAVAALAVGAAACGPGDAEQTPTAAPTTSASESPSATPEETTTAESSTPSIPPPDPADYPGKDEHTEEGAKQAFAFYWATAIHTYQTGDLASLRSLQSENCKACKATNDEIDELLDVDGLWSRASFSVDHLVVTEVEGAEAEVDVQLEFTTSAHSEFIPESGRRGEKPAESYLALGGLNWERGGWKIADYALVKTSDSAEDG